MLIASHVSVQELAITNPASKFESFVQEKRVLSDLMRMQLNSGVQLVYLPIIQVTTATPSSSTPITSLPSSVTMEPAVVTQQAPTQVTKTVSKPKSKQPISGASQKAPVAKTTSKPKGSDQVKVRDEGRGQHQRNPKNKVGELSESQPSHTVSSQKGTAVEKEKAHC